MSSGNALFIFSLLTPFFQARLPARCLGKPPKPSISKALTSQGFICELGEVFHLIFFFFLIASSSSKTGSAFGFEGEP